MTIIAFAIVFGLVSIRFAVRYRPVVLWQSPIPPPKLARYYRGTPRYVCDDEVLLAVIERGGIIEYVIAMKV